MQDNLARMIGTIGIWLSVAITLAFGVFRMNWNGDGPMFVMFLVVAVICGAAAISTRFIWKSQRHHLPPGPPAI